MEHLLEFKGFVKFSMKYFVLFQINQLESWYTSSLDDKLRVRVELTRNLVLRDVKEADAAAGAAITVAGKGDGGLEELLDHVAGHVRLVVGIDEALDEHTAGAGGGEVTRCLEAGLVDLVDLVALIRVPAGANHAGGQVIAIVEDDLTHDAGGGLDGREAAELLGLDLEVVADHARNHGGVRTGAGTLAVDALVDGLELVGAIVSDVETGTAAISREHDAAVVLGAEDGGL